MRSRCRAIGFDYGAFEASYPNSLGDRRRSPAPGASPQSDVTVSSQGLFNLPVGGGIINGPGGAVLPAGAAGPALAATALSAKRKGEGRRLRPAPFSFYEPPAMAAAPPSASATPIHCNRPSRSRSASDASATVAAG